MAKHGKQPGQIIIIAIVLMAIIFAISVALLGYTTINVKSSRQTYAENQAYYLADAGLNKAIYQLNQSSAYNGETDTQLGNGTFSVTVATIDSNTKRITATGYIPNSTNPTSSETLKASVSITTADISFNNGVQVGAGGLTMGNGSAINGNVFSNGSISGGGTIAGDVVVAEGTPALPDQSWSTQTSDYPLGDVNSHQYDAQSFVPSGSGKLNKISVYIKKVGAPGDITVRIMSDNSGVPSKTILSNTTISAALITTSYGWIDATFSAQANLVAGTKYWIMLGTASNSNSNYFLWGLDAGDGYASGTGMHSSNWNAGNPVWSSSNGDYDFQAYVGGVLTTLSGVTVQGNVHADGLSNCSITKDAYYLSLSSCTVGGVTFPGTAAPGPASMPISHAQITQWETVASGGGVLAGPYNINGTQTLGPVEINGDLTVTNGATLVLTGPVWVKGSITLSNNAIIKIDNSLGNAGTILMADNPSNESASGLVSVSNNVIISGNGNTNSFVLILSNSTSASALQISNNAAGAIFYAANGTAVLSNNAGGNQVTGYAVNMSNNSTVTYTTGLQSSLFSNGPGGSWAYVPGSYVVVK